MKQRSGIAIPLVVIALVVFFILAGTLLFTSKGEYRLVKRTEDRERARYIAEAGLAVASALVFQNDFQDRWYKRTLGKYGYTHAIAGDFAGGTYKVRAEDVMNELTDEMKKDKVKLLEKLTYKRVDLFCRGSFHNESVVLYQSLSLEPEEPVYGYNTQTLEVGGGLTRAAYSNVRIR